MHTTVLIPARDEGPRVGATVHAARRALPDARVVVVDGGSLDQTGLVARQAGATVIRQRGTGYAGALLAGYRHLLDSDVARVVQLDADGQHPAAAAPLLLGALGPGQHMVIGSRHGTTTGGGLRRRAGNHVLSHVVRALAGARIHDVTSGFWAFDRHALAALARHLPVDCADANVRILALRLGLCPVEVPVTMQPRSSGRSMHDGVAGMANFATSLRRAIDASRVAVPVLDSARPEAQQPHPTPVLTARSPATALRS